MNNRFITYLISVFALVGATTSYAPIGTIDEWTKESPGTQRVITFSDLHYDRGNQKNTDKQRADIIEAVKRNNALVIVEDMIETTGVLQQFVKASNGREQAISLYDRNHKSNGIVRASPLHYMTQACKQAGVDCVNVEFRHYLLPLPDRSPRLPGEEDAKYQEEVKRVYATIPVPQPCLKDVTAALRNVVDEVSTYNGALTKYYASVLSEDKLKLLEGVLKTIEYNIEIDTNKNIECNERTFYRVLKDIYEKQLKVSASHNATPEMSDVKAYLDTFDEALDSVLEARIMHHIAQSKANTVLVCAGREHIRKIAPGLKALGYTHTKTTQGNGNKLDGAINIADYFDLDIKMEVEESTPVITPRRSSYSRLFYLCTAAAVGVLGYLGYQYWYKKIFNY